MEIWPLTKMLMHRVLDPMTLFKLSMFKYKLWSEPSPIEQLALMNKDNFEFQTNGTQVLFWRGPAGRETIYFEAIMALALQLRGISTTFIVCDGIMSGCLQRSIEDKEPISEWGKRCNLCFRWGIHVLKNYGIPYIKISDFVPLERRAEFREICDDLPAEYLESHEYCTIPVGNFAKASKGRYFKGMRLGDSEAILREYLYSSLVCSEAAMNILNDLAPSRVFMQRHIEYVDWAPAYVVLTKARLPTTLFARGVGLDECVTLRNVASTDWTSLYTLNDETWEAHAKQYLANEEEEALDAVLNNPWSITVGINESELIHNRSSPTNKNKEKLIHELNISDNKPIWCLFAHLTWDSGQNPYMTAFEDIFDWTLTTVEAMLETRDITWLLKVHPGETLGTFQGVEELIKDEYPKAAKCIRFIPANSKITTRKLRTILSGGITMYGTIGVQLPAQGIPVIVGERTHYSGKGFTYDGFTRPQYLELIHKAATIPPLSKHQRNLARRYAYVLYYKRSIPFKITKSLSAYKPLDPRKVHLLFPGNYAVMDMICDRIMNGGEFILDDPLCFRSE